MSLALETHNVGVLLHDLDLGADSADNTWKQIVDLVRMFTQFDIGTQMIRQGNSAASDVFALTLSRKLLCIIRIGYICIMCWSFPKTRSCSWTAGKSRLHQTRISALLNHENILPNILDSSLYLIKNCKASQTHLELYGFRKP